MSDPSTNDTNNGQEPELRWEWGVRHAQGTRVETSERAAREWLEMSLQRKRRYDVSAPYLVRRRISDWVPAEAAK